MLVVHLLINLYWCCFIHTMHDIPRRRCRHDQTVCRINHLAASFECGKSIDFHTKFHFRSCIKQTTHGIHWLGHCRDFVKHKMLFVSNDAITLSSSSSSSSSSLWLSSLVDFQFQNLRHAWYLFCRKSPQKRSLPLRGRPQTIWLSWNSLLLTLQRIQMHKFTHKFFDFVPWLSCLSSGRFVLNAN